VKKRIQQPFLVKLLLVFLLTGILILSAVAGYLYFLSKDIPPTHYFLHRGLQKCTASLATEIGNPPNIEHAKELANELDLGIRITTPQGESWESSKNTAQNAPIYKVFNKGVVYEFHMQPTEPLTRNLLREVLVLLLLLITILAVSFFVIRWMLRPLKRLVEGVEAIAEGQLDYRLSMQPGGEFESIGNAFDHMTSKVKQMISAREQLLTDLSHELRSPLTRIRLSSEFIGKPELKMSLQEDVIEMEEMIADVLEAARLSTPYGTIHKAEVDLSALVEELSGKYTNQAPGVVFDSPGPCIILGNASQLKSAIRNLIENALKYSAEQSKAVELYLAKDDAGASLKVVDHGIGIPQEDQTLIFEAFYRVDKSRTRSTGGYGLGLNLCKKIVEAHGGTIAAANLPTRGCEFRVTLPATP